MKNQFTSSITLVICLALFVTPAMSNTLLVANKSSISVSFIQEPSLKEVLELKIGDADEDTPHEIATSPNGQWALVSHYGKVSYNVLKFEFDNLRHAGSKLSLIDVKHGNVVRRIELPSNSSPHGIQFLSDTQALVTAEGIQSLLLVDFADVVNYRVTYFPLPGKGAHVIALDAKKNFAYIANKDSGSVVKFDVVNFRAINEQIIGKHAEGITLTPDDASVLVTDRLSNLVTMLDAKTLQIRSRLTTESGPIRIVVGEQGKSALVTNVIAGTAQRVDLTRMTIAPGFKTTTDFNTNTGKLCESFFGLLKVPVNMLMRDDQQTAFIANSYAGNITLVNFITGQVLRTFTAGKEPDGMALSSVDRENANGG